MNARTIPVITIDGPTSSGKGTIGKMLADSLKWHFLDSGILYRVLALAVLQQQQSTDTNCVLSTKKSIRPFEKPDFPKEIEFCKRSIDEIQDLIAATLKQPDVMHKIREETCGICASKLAVIPQVREAISCYCKTFRCTHPPGIVADGRDMGTTVFPDAILKIFLTASPEIRAQRRYLQLQSQKISASLHEILSELKARDQRDKSRSIAPLKPADDAQIIDTSNLSISEVLQILQRIVQEKGL